METWQQYSKDGHSDKLVPISAAFEITKFSSTCSFPLSITSFHPHWRSSLPYLIPPQENRKTFPADRNLFCLKYNPSLHMGVYFEKLVPRSANIVRFDAYKVKWTRRIENWQLKVFCWAWIVSRTPTTNAPHIKCPALLWSVIKSPFFFFLFPRENVYGDQISSGFMSQVGIVFHQWCAFLLIPESTGLFQLHGTPEESLEPFTS